MSDDAIIKVDAVVKTYATAGGQVPALSAVSTNIRNGDFVSIVGPSGCGKTTLLKMIGGLIEPSAGSIELRGSPVTGPREDVGFVFQGAVLLPWKTVLENVLLPIQVKRRVTAQDRARAFELLDSLGLTNFDKRYPAELSGGMQQRVSICRALIGDPSCLLLDEPFGALDALTRENINVLFNQIWRGTRKTVLLVTHSIQEAVFLSTRVLVMSKRPGEIVDDIQIDLPEERLPELIGSPEFGALANRIRPYFTKLAID
ncbi:ABC transporter ATP-binding protein [Devosia ginsengisoli]|uniref:ABC transporter ATP-binding protein n=1 Tax=Devosia ginsengisoli TaxID=400770 RepID=A0A5B8LWL5_9HYPH|nr:ABC transporter ATP-binding protein [Devosia ginsengisoli]QDZ11965.1 ABC transporter ATP-binding protein [Devosia ginsengisoli]